MADARRLPLVAFLAGALVVAGAFGSPAGNGGGAGAVLVGQAPSEAPDVALSSSWYCAGGSTAGGAAPGDLLVDNGGPGAVKATVRLVSSSGSARQLDLSLASGSYQVLPERLATTGGRAGAWVGALVTLYGGMASVNEVVSTPEGSVSQPCASSPSSQWYFPDGATLRNASDDISLLDPYPVAAVVDLSFTTELGQEEPDAFRGVVVPARGLTVLDLGNHLRRRSQIAVTVTARSGGIVAFETELVTKPPARAPRLGTPGALDPVLPQAGPGLTLGAGQTSTSWWWPEGADGSGFTERYVVYNPGGNTAELTLSLVAAGSGAGLGSSQQLTVGPYGTSVVTVNGQPWALPGIAYAVHLQGTNGVPVVAARSVTAGSPSLYRGVGSLLGEAVPADQWLVAPNAQVLEPRIWLEVLDPGSRPAVVSVESVSAGKRQPLAGLASLVVAPGQHDEEQLSGADTDQVLIVSSSQPVLVEKDSYAAPPANGVSLAPLVVLGPPG
ncbi:MAG: DUF5719 family protein [Acidimicrobiales bacterium]